jgi:hypothetical protein
MIRVHHSDTSASTLTTNRSVLLNPLRRRSSSSCHSYRARFAVNTDDQPARNEKSRRESQPSRRGFWATLYGIAVRLRFTSVPPEISQKSKQFTKRPPLSWRRAMPKSSSSARFSRVLRLHTAPDRRQERCADGGSVILTHGCVILARDCQFMELLRSGWHCYCLDVDSLPTMAVPATSSYPPLFSSGSICVLPIGGVSVSR